MMFELAVCVNLVYDLCLFFQYVHSIQAVGREEIEEMEEGSTEISKRNGA